jgi:ankyrin repeat protein
MRTQAIRFISAIMAALFWLPLTGCDPHGKTWDANSGTATPGSGGQNSTDPPQASSEVSITVGSSGAISCKVNGASIAPVRHRSAVPEDTASTGPLLIVTDTTHDTEESFAVPASLNTTNISADGRVTLRHIQHSLIIESNGPAGIILYSADSQDDIDDCVQFAGDADIDRLANRLSADPTLVDGRDSKLGKTALIKAAESGRAGVVLYLLNHKASTEIRDSGGYTALHRAVIQGRFEVVKLLARHGADVNALTKAGNSPVRLATTRRYRDIAAFLVGAGASGEVAQEGPPRPKPRVQEKAFELTDQNEYGPFPDGSSIRYADGLLYVLRGDQANANNWDEFDLPKTQNTWIALQGTHLKVLVRGNDFRHVWASYRPE